MDMEPIGAAAGIAQISRSAWKLGSYIYTVYQGAKTIDESVQSLALEVNGLASTCDLVHNELGTVLTKPGSGSTVSRYDKDGRLRRCIDHQVAQCKHTLGELEAVVETLWPRKESFFVYIQKPTVRHVNELKAQALCDMWWLQHIGVQIQRGQKRLSVGTCRPIKARDFSTPVWGTSPD